MTRPYSRLGSSKPRGDSERKIKLDLEYLVSQITRLRRPYCVLCGDDNWHVLECGHFWHRAMPPTEFDLLNLNTLCHNCNAAHESNPEPYRRYMLETLTQEQFDHLEWRAHSNIKMGYVALFNLREEMKALLAEEKWRVA